MLLGAFAAVALAAGVAAAGTGQRTVIHAGMLLAIPGQTAEARQTITIEQGRIARIESGFADGSPEDRLIDLSCCFVLPGFIDLHVHLTSPVESGGRLRVVTETAADLAITAAVFARETLEAGFTTVLDLGTGRRAHEEAIYALRKATAAHRLPGPRILAVGSPISPTGLSRTGLFRFDVETVVGPQGVCDGPDDCRRAVREQIKRGADAINFYNTGSLLDEHIVEQTFTDAEMRAIVETAHELGRKVIADGHTALGVNAALRAGADIVDTVPWPDEVTWRLLSETGAYFVPHLYAFEVSIGDTEDTLTEGTTAWLPEPILQRLLSIKRAPYSAEIAHQRGVRIAFGSDTGVIPHGSNAGEFDELVKAGLSSMDAIVAATLNAARALGLDGEIGSLRPGFVADLVAVDGNPLGDIEQLGDIDFVMREGVIYKNRL
jgi:imidazolonepropionase-like amidohydrolase